MYSEGAQNYEIDPKIHLRSEDKSKTFLGSTTLSGIYNLNAGEKATIRENLNKQAYISHNLPFKKVDFPKTLKPRVNGEEHTAHPQTKHVEQTRITQAISMQQGKDLLRKEKYEDAEKAFKKVFSSSRSAAAWESHIT